MAAPVLLASGRDADIFALDAHRVLRRYRRGGDVSAEAAIMAHVGALGFPVPRVYAADRADLVLERLDGPTMLDALEGSHRISHPGSAPRWPPGPAADDRGSDCCHHRCRLRRSIGQEASRSATHVHQAIICGAAGGGMPDEAICRSFLVSGGIALQHSGWGRSCGH